jgi:hypothetical protein
MWSTIKRNGLQEYPTNSLTAAATQKIGKQMQCIEKTQQMKSQNHPNIYIYYNNIN